MRGVGLVVTVTGDPVPHRPWAPFEIGRSGREVGEGWGRRPTDQLKQPVCPTGSSCLLGGPNASSLPSDTQLNARRRRTRRAHHSTVWHRIPGRVRQSPPTSTFRPRDAILTPARRKGTPGDASASPANRSHGWSSRCKPDRAIQTDGLPIEEGVLNDLDGQLREFFGTPQSHRMRYLLGQ